MKIAIIAITLYTIVGTVLILTALSMFSTAVRKHIKARIEEHLKALEELERISNEIDNEIDAVKLKVYEIYLDKCKDRIRKKQKTDNELKDKLEKLKKS